jgi:hypothetical protein
MLKLFGAGRPDHPMADPGEVRRLLDGLPPHDPFKSLDELAHWLESVGTAEGFKPESRIQVLFSLDEAAQPRIRKITREYLAAARPSRFQENRIWTHAHEYYRQAGQAYGRAIDSILQGAKGAEAAASLLPLLVVRALRALAQQVKWLYLRYGPVDPALWRLINNIYAFAELRGIAGTPVSAVYPLVAGGSTPRAEFLRAVMLGVSSPDSLLPPEIDIAERLIADSAADFALARAPGAGLSYWIDLGQAMAPQRLTRPPQPGVGLRFVGAGGSLSVLEKLVQRIETTGQVPSGIGAGPSDDAEMVLDVVRHLVLYWAPAAPDRKHKRHSVKSRLSIVHGFATLGGVLQAATAWADSATQPENWIVDNVSAGGFGAVVPQAKGDWLKLGALIAMQPDGGNNWIVGMIRRVTRISPHEARVGIETLSRAPEVVRFIVDGESEEGVLLPFAASGTGETAIALRAGLFVPGRNLDIERGGRTYVYMPQRVAERGDDYDIVRYKEMIRES